MSPDINNTTDQTAKQYEKLLRSLTNASSSLAMYPSGHPIIKKQIKTLFEEINKALSNNDLLSIHRGQNILLVNDKQITDSKALEKIIKHFDDFKITDLEISKGVTAKELENFLNIFGHSEKESKMYPSLNEACKKNQITHIKSLQAAYIRVPKNVKDKLGGKTVGEIKISKPEMERLISYLKGQISLEHPKETKIYKKIFKNHNLISSLVDKIIVDSSKKAPEERKKLVLVVLNQVGKYLAQNSSSANKQKESIKIITALEKALDSSKTFIALGSDKALRGEVKQTVEKIKSLVKNQTLVAEYSKYQKKLEGVKEKLQKIPALADVHLDHKSSTGGGGKTLLGEIKKLLKKINKAKVITSQDSETINSLLEKINQHL